MQPDHDKLPVPPPPVPLETAERLGPVWALAVALAGAGGVAALWWNDLLGVSGWRTIVLAGLGFVVGVRIPPVVELMMARTHRARGDMTGTDRRSRRTGAGCDQLPDDAFFWRLRLELFDGLPGSTPGGSPIAENAR